MGWTLNSLEKTADVTYEPGSPYIAGVPGTAGKAAYSYWEETFSGSYLILSAQKPDGYDSELGAFYKSYGGVKARLAFISSSDGEIFLYTYQHPGRVIKTLVHVPAVAPTPATPGQPYTASQTIIDNRLGWNSGALGPAELPYGSALTWRFSAGSVGAVVGLARLADPQDEGYLGFALGVMTTSGHYTIIKNGSVVTGSKRFFDDYTFAISRKGDDTIQVVVNGAVEYSINVPEALIADTSLFSAGDVVWDTHEVLSDALVINDDISGETLSNAGVVASAINVTKVFGPGTDLGVIGAETLSDGVAGAVLVNGVVQVYAEAETLTDGQGQGYPTRMLGVGTTIGIAGSITESDAVVESLNTASGGGDMGFVPLTGAGADDASFSGWTGNYQGDSVNMLPMDGDSAADLITPILGIVAVQFPPLNADSTGINGEVSTSSVGEMAPMIALGNGNDTEDLDFGYGLSEVAFFPLLVFSSDAEAPESTGAADLYVRFILNGSMRSTLPNRAYLRSHNEFRISAYGGGHADGKVPLLSIEAEGTTEGLGSFYGEIGYA